MQILLFFQSKMLGWPEIALLLLPLLTTEVAGVEVYDCAESRATFDIIDLTETEDCEKEEARYLDPTAHTIQVLHTDQTRTIPGVRCRVVESKMVSVCSKVYHLSLIHI